MTEHVEPDPLVKKRALPRLTKWSLVWLILLPPIGWELEMVRRGIEGGPLSHVAWWAYGEQWSLRWWLCSCTVAAFFLWTVWHFSFVTPAVRELLTLLGFGVLAGICGWLFTHIA